MHVEQKIFPAWSLTSMTGSGHVRHVNHDVTVEVYVKSVNHRNLDCKFRLAKELTFFENEYVACVTSMAERGRVDLQISLEFNQPNHDIGFAEERALAWVCKLSALRERYPDMVAPVTIKDILHLPGMIKDHDEPAVTEEIKRLVLQALKAALIDLIQARVREGALLQVTIKDMLAASFSLINTIEMAANADVEHRFARNKQRVKELFSEHAISEDRLYQELALLAERADFKEEIDRLRAHVEHFDDICQQIGAKGRKLDFLCQEMLRESNTLLSKACSHDVIKQAIDLKAHVERIREQVQNIE